MCNKLIWKPGNLLYPLPVVLVSCGNKETHNLITIAWTGTVCTKPPMLYISVRPERYSYKLIRSNMEFTVHLVDSSLAFAADYCGVCSGENFDKFRALKLTPVDGIQVACPYIQESSLAMECKVVQILELGSHHMFIANVLNTIADEKYFNKKTSKFEIQKAGLISYNNGRYYKHGKFLGTFGYSVKKRK
ncbi:MAG: flavin reductase family protein [Bacteroidales bacterium]|nr:flavin reductase family protein [Bacteroidales bacterium]